MNLNRLILTTLLGGVALMGASTAARAATLTFDDLSGQGQLGSYGGLNWTNMWHLDSSQPVYAGSGYRNGTVSGNQVVYNAWANAASVSQGTFTFNSTYLTAAWTDNLSIRVQGFLGAATLYDQTVVVNHTGPTLFTFNFVGIDNLRFDSFGGAHVPGLNGAGNHFAMDNFTFNEAVAAPVPEPATMVLLGSGLAGLILRRRRQAAR